jgi:hypothetical protein
MQFLECSDLDFRKIKKDYEAVKKLLLKGEYKAVDLKKLKGSAYYRVKLNYADRLLLAVASYKEKKCLIAAEIIHNHEYEKSRFLRGGSFQEDEVNWEEFSREDKIDEGATRLKYVNPQHPQVHFLNKFVSFDEQQLEIYQRFPPVLISGPAGSGKTLILLEKMKLLQGNGLYVTQSSFLVDHARSLYSSAVAESQKQDVDFLALNQLLSAVAIPEGREARFSDFRRFLSLYGGASEFSSLVKEAQKVFEEFKGVITGSVLDAAYLSREEYLSLGVKQTIFLDEERGKVYSLFEKYLAFLKRENLYDGNILTFSYLPKITAKYDFAVVDEIQDLTPVQIMAILKSLVTPDHFIFCGDGHQIVHPNFFSWAKMKTFLFQLKENNFFKTGQQQILHVITNNFRNARKVTELSNKILMIKNLRFGSVDKESHFLLQGLSDSDGRVDFYRENTKLCQDLNKNTKKSIKWAIIVMGEEQKSLAKAHFQTPLIFSIHEAKGLEYENLIIFNMVSAFEREYRQIAEGVSSQEMMSYLADGRNTDFSRQKDKEDKSLEALKFYVNSAYVAVTRAVESIVWIESTRKHPFFDLLQVESKDVEVAQNISIQESSMEEWQLEAAKLAAQGKEEQANAIKNEYLKIIPPPWTVMDHDNYFPLQREALNKDVFNKKSKQKLYEFAHTYRLYNLFPRLEEARHARAKTPEKDIKYVHQLYHLKYDELNMKQLKKDVETYGPDFKNEMGTPVLTSTALANNPQGVSYLLSMGAKVEARDMLGGSPIERLVGATFYRNDIPLHWPQYVKTYKLLSHKPLTFKYKERAIMVMPHKAEFFLINLLMGGFSFHYCRSQNYITSGMMETFLQDLPEEIIPSWRKTRRYWNGILANNHFERGNLCLLMRWQTGVYVINPELEIEIDGKWQKVYDVLRVNFLDLFTTKKNFLRQYLDNRPGPA